MEICDAIIINDKFYPMAENLDSLKELENKLTYIDQPLNSRLSSLLQILCKKSNNPKMIEYILKQGANPYYMDIDGNTAYEYAIENIYHMKDWLFILLNQYSSRFNSPNIDTRNQFVFDFIKAEIVKHEIKAREKERILLQELDNLSIDEVF
jgi:ankyrin repeat protein